jgi:hypothetical protein
MACSDQKTSIAKLRFFKREAGAPRTILGRNDWKNRATVNITDAQRDVRSVFLGGFAGQLVSSVVWFLSADLATWHSTRSAIITFVFGGMFVFPLRQLFLRVMGRPFSFGKAHPMNALAMLIALTVPFSLPLVPAATLHRLNWFFLAFMPVVGAHCVPFISLYGMWQFGVLAGLLVGGGIVIGTYLASILGLGDGLLGQCCWFLHSLDEM